MKIIDDYIEYMAREPYMSKHALVWGIFSLLLGVSFFFFAILAALNPQFFDDPYSTFALLLCLMGTFWILVGKRLLEKQFSVLFNKK